RAAIRPNLVLKGSGMSSTRAARSFPLPGVLVMLGLAAVPTAQGQSGPPAERGRPDRAGPREGAAPGRPTAETKKGLIRSAQGAFAGYTLFAPQHSTTTYLVDMKGEVAHTWPSKYTPGEAVYLLDDGSLLRCEREPDQHHFRAGGIGGRVERI